MKVITRAALASALALSSVAVAAPEDHARDRGEWVYRDADGRAFRQSQLRGAPAHSVARQWNEVLLDAIRRDFARPTVHARNLCHVSLGMWDAWAIYDTDADTYIHHESQTAANVQAAREEAISYACYRILTYRFNGSPGEVASQAEFDQLMLDLGYDKNITTLVGNTPAAVGNRVADTILSFGAFDGSNEAGNYANQHYAPVNQPLLPDFPGNPNITDPNRWQPLALQFFVDQGGNPIPFGYPEFLSPEWGQVSSFALSSDDLTIYNRDSFNYLVYHDPGPPPIIGGVGDDYYRWGFELVSIWSSHLDPADAVMIDISPNSFGNTPLPAPGDWATYYDIYNGGDWGTGHTTNPATMAPYTPQIVPRGDYTRILAEFWADGPASETPPGHWFTILNYVLDHPLFEHRFRGMGPIVDDLELDVKLYFILGGTMHDVAISAWGVKGWYDYLRPISAIRYMADQYAASGAHAITLHPGFIEEVTPTSVLTYHSHLAGEEGKIAVLAWKGPDYITDPDTDVAGVDWILAENWWPYQRPTFVTPPFAGYVSGHSTYSRAAAEVMTLITGSPFFPGGMGEFFCPQNEFLVFEDGPSVDVTLQWATYQDASDQTSMSRIWGGIHPPADDIPGRHMGIEIGPDAFWHATRYFRGVITCPGDADGNQVTDVFDFNIFAPNFGTSGHDPYTNGDMDGDGDVDVFDFNLFASDFGCS